MNDSVDGEPPALCHRCGGAARWRAIALAEHAAVIRALGKRVVGDVIEIGRRLSECKVIAGHGNWLQWLDREFGWSERTAQDLMNVHEAFGSNPRRIADLVLPAKALYLLAAPSTPEEVREAGIERVEAGEKAMTGGPMLAHSAGHRSGLF